MQENIQQLDFDIIKKSGEKFDEITEEIISLEIDGEQTPFKVGMYKTFSTVAIKECVMELIEKVGKAKSIDKDGLGDIMMPFTMFMCIKHFTTLTLPNVFEEQVMAIKHMLNNGSLIQIYLNFDEEQLELLKKEIESVMETFGDNMELMETLKKDYIDKIEDKSLLDF